jgi:hypothetical protein
MSARMDVSTDDSRERDEVPRRSKTASPRFVRSSILRRLGKSDRRTSGIVEHQLHVRVDGLGF